jgi:RNA polymerase sigma factor (sigma-70 family)
VSHLEPDANILHNQVNTVVAKLLNDFEWQLLPMSQVAEGVVAVFPPSQPTTVEYVRRRAISIYCAQGLHPAVLGRLGPPAQQRAFEELGRYLYRVALATWRDLAQDITQETLVVLYEKAQDCRTPEAFLAFALQKQRDTAKKWLRSVRHTQSLDELLETDPFGEPRATATTTAPASNPATETIDRELREAVVQRLRTLRAESGRAGRQLEAVWLRYVQEMSLEECATVLETTPANVSVLLNRGLERLRSDATLLTLAEELVQEK